MSDPSEWRWECFQTHRSSWTLHLESKMRAEDTPALAESAPASGRVLGGVVRQQHERTHEQRLAASQAAAEKRKANAMAPEERRTKRRLAAQEKRAAQRLERLLDGPATSSANDDTDVRKVMADLIASVRSRLQMRSRRAGSFCTINSNNAQ